MLNEHSYAKLVEVFETINKSLEEADETELSAQEAFEYLDVPGFSRRLVELYSTPDVTTKPISEINPPTEWDYTVGLDSSNTRTIRLNSGEIATASVATLGVAGDSEEVQSLKNHQTVNAVVYSSNPDFSLQDIDNDDDDLVDVETLQIPPYVQTNRIESWVQGLSLLHSEFKHTDTLAEKINGPLFIDGPIYSGNFFWFLRHQYNQKRSKDTENKNNPEKNKDDDDETLQTPLNVIDSTLLDIFQYRINTIDSFYQRNLPLIGVVKTSQSSSVIEEIKKGYKRVEEKNSYQPIKPDQAVRWTKDMPFFNELLKSEMSTKEEEKEAVISYTPWIVQNYHSIGNDMIQPFMDYPGISFNMYSDISDATEIPYENYQIAFFYITVPYKNFCLRIETPRGFVDKMGDEIQTLVASQIAADKNIPASIQFADDNARISEEARANLESYIKKPKNSNFNEYRGYN